MKVEPQQKEAEGGVKVKSEQVKPSVKVKSEQVKPSVVKSESKPVFTVDIRTMHGTNSQEADQSVPLETKGLRTSWWPGLEGLCTQQSCAISCCLQLLPKRSLLQLLS